MCNAVGPSRDRGGQDLKKNSKSCALDSKVEGLDSYTQVSKHRAHEPCWKPMREAGKVKLTYPPESELEIRVKNQGGGHFQN